MLAFNQTYVCFQSNIYQLFVRSPFLETKFRQMQLLDKVAPFKSSANDFSEVNPVLSFYLYKYYMATAIGLYRDLSEASQKSQLQAEIKSVQKQMAKMKTAAGNLNQPNDIKQITEYTELMFAKNDHFYRQGQITKEVAQDFLTLFRLYEVCNRFTKLDQNQNKRRLYCKKKFIQIMKQVKNGGNLSSKTSQKKQSIVQPPPPPPQAKLSVQQINKSILKSGFKPDLPKPSKIISYDKVTMQIQATKYLQNAVSELSFDRYKHAREQALRALQLLDQLIQN